MNIEAEDFISLKDIVAEIALPKRSYDRNTNRHVRQPAQTILNDPKSERYFSRAASISEAAQSLRRALKDQEAPLGSVRPSERSRVWYDTDAVVSTEHQAEVVAEVLFLLGLLGQWADRVSSSALPIASLDQVLPLARSRDQKRLEKIGLLRRDAENLASAFVSRWGRRDRLARQMFANATNPPPNETASDAAPTVELAALPEADAPAAFPEIPSTDLEEIPPHFLQLQGSTGHAPERPTRPVRISDFLFKIAEEFCKGRRTTMQEVSMQVLAALDLQVDQNACIFPFQGMDGEEYVFKEKGRRMPLTAAKIKGRLRKNGKLIDRVNSSRDF